MSTQHLNESLGRVESSIARLQDKALKALDLAESFSRENERLRALNTELLAALKLLVDIRENPTHYPIDAYALALPRANAAIARAEEETK